MEFVDIDVGQETDTITLRGTVPNPTLSPEKGSNNPPRELTNDEFVTVLLEATEPVQTLTVPREAIMTDQRGDYVYVVSADNRAQRRTVRLGQSTSGLAVITDGPRECEKVVLEGVQRVQPNMEVSPGPADTGAKPRVASRQADGDP